MNKLKLGEIVKEARVKRQWTLRLLCENINNELSPSYISEVEQSLEIPSRDAIYILAQGLGLNFDELIEIAIEEKAEELKLLVKKKYYKNKK